MTFPPDPAHPKAQRPIPDAWLASPPETLVAGEGAFAAALALILGAGRIEFEALRTDPFPLPGGAYPLVLDELRRVFLVAGTHHGAAELLAAHAGMWRWVERLSEGRDQHLLAVVFVLPPEAGEGLISSLALALALPGFDPATSGHSVVRMDEPLEKLLETAAATRARDAVVLRNRIEADQRHAALRELAKAAGAPDAPSPDGATDEALQLATARVLEQFAGREYDLDLFCRPPHHANGNALRQALRRIVTGEVTPTLREEILHSLAALR